MFAEDLENDIKFITLYLNSKLNIGFIRFQNVGNGWCRLKSKQWEIAWHKSSDEGLVRSSEIRGTGRLDVDRNSSYVESFIVRHVWRGYVNSK